MMYKSYKQGLERYERKKPMRNMYDELMEQQADTIEERVYEYNQLLMFNVLSRVNLPHYDILLTNPKLRGARQFSGMYSQHTCNCTPAPTEMYDLCMEVQAQHIHNNVQNYTVAEDITAQWIWERPRRCTDDMCEMLMERYKKDTQ